MTTPLRARSLPGAAAPLPGPRLRSAAPHLRPGPPPLRLVDHARILHAARARRRRRLATLAAVFAGLAFVALAGSHAYLVTNQVRIDELQRLVEEEQHRHIELRLLVATLTAPERIIEEAEAMGMVEADRVTPVARATRPAPATGPARPAPGDEGSAGSDVPLPWTTMKANLGRDG